MQSSQSVDLLVDEESRENEQQIETLDGEIVERDAQLVEMCQHGGKDQAVKFSQVKSEGSESGGCVFVQQKAIRCEWVI